MRSWTDEELLGLESQVDGKWELVDGEIVMSPGGGRHGRVIVRLPRKIMDKVREYLAAGVGLVWVIDPEKETAVAYRSLTEGRQVLGNESLDGGDVVPGFTCPLAQIFG